MTHHIWKPTTNYLPSRAGRVVVHVFVLTLGRIVVLSCDPERGAVLKDSTRCLLDDTDNLRWHRGPGGRLLLPATKDTCITDNNLQSTANMQGDNVRTKQAEHTWHMADYRGPAQECAPPRQQRTVVLLHPGSSTERDAGSDLASLEPSCLS